MKNNVNCSKRKRKNNLYTKTINQSTNRKENCSFSKKRNFLNYLKKITLKILVELTILHCE